MMRMLEPHRAPRGLNHFKYVFMPNAKYEKILKSPPSRPRHAEGDEDFEHDCDGEGGLLDDDEAQVEDDAEEGDEEDGESDA